MIIEKIRTGEQVTAVLVNNGKVRIIGNGSDIKNISLLKYFWGKLIGWWR